MKRSPDWPGCLPLVIAALIGSVSPNAGAACTREISVPVSPQGRLVTVEAPLPRGVLPDLLRELGASAGCVFSFPSLPRARAERSFFEQHIGDVYLPAVRKPDRDQDYAFVSLGQHPMAAVAPKARPIPERLDLLMKDPSLRAVFVRGVWLGDDYGRAVQFLANSGRADFVSDFGALGRMLKAGRAAFTLLPYVPALGALDDSASATGWDGAFTATALQDVPRLDVGLYLSKRNLPAADLEAIEGLLTRARHDGSLRQFYLRYYPESTIKTIQF